MSDKIKILMIGPYPPPYSGPEISMKLFLDSRLKDEFDLHFLKTNFRKDNVKKGRFDIAMVVAFWVFFSKLLCELTFHRPDLVYYPITPTILGWIGRDALVLILCRIFRIKSVIHLRGSHFRLNFNTFNPYVQKLIRFATRDVAVGIVQADYLHDEFSVILPPDRIKTLYQAIDTKNFPFKVKKFDTNSKKKVLFVGHLTQAKGFCDLLEAIPKVLKQCPETEFQFAGNMRRGERGVFFNQFSGQRLVYADPFAAESRLLENISPSCYRNLGIIIGEKKMKYFHEADVFVMPSYSEGFSRALLEALSMGKAVVYTPVGAHREIMEDGVNGVEVLPGDVAGLAGAIVGLLKNPDKCMQIGKENSQYARTRFDINLIVNSLSEIFRKVVRN